MSAGSGEDLALSCLDRFGEDAELPRNCQRQLDQNRYRFVHIGGRLCNLRESWLTGGRRQPMCRDHEGETETR